MHEGNRITGGYDFGAIAFESVRHELRKESVDTLSKALESVPQINMNTGQELKAVATAVDRIDGDLYPELLTATYSPVYESADIEGVAIDSKIVVLANDRKNLRLTSALSLNGELSDKVYLIAAVASGQTSISLFNLCYGALVHEDGTTVFFKVKKFGDLEEDERPVELKELASATGFDDAYMDKKVVAVQVKSEEEHLISDEFQKAAQEIGKQNDDQVQPKDTDQLSNEVKDKMAELGLDPNNEQHVNRMKVRMPQFFSVS